MAAYGFFENDTTADPAAAGPVVDEAAILQEEECHAPVLTPAPPKGTLTDYVESFTRRIKRLILLMHEKMPNDPLVRRIKERVLLAIDLFPVGVVNETGYWLFEYREKIYAGETKFFLDSDYDREICESVDIEKANLAAGIIPKIKEQARTLDADGRRHYLGEVQALLDDYLEYLALKAAN